MLIPVEEVSGGTRREIPTDERLIERAKPTDRNGPIEARTIPIPRPADTRPSVPVSAPKLAPEPSRPRSEPSRPTAPPPPIPAQPPPPAGVGGGGPIQIRVEIPNLIPSSYNGPAPMSEAERAAIQLERERMQLQAAQMETFAKLFGGAAAPPPAPNVGSGSSGPTVTLPPDTPYNADEDIAGMLTGLFNALASSGGNAAPLPQQQSPAVLIAPTGGSGGESSGPSMLPIVILTLLGIGGYFLWKKFRG